MTSQNENTDASEFKFSNEQGYFDKSLGVKLIIGVIFALSLFSILHFREVRVEVLELGSIAPSYIVAQTDLEFYDEEATIILRQEAVRDIGKIYEISDKQIKQVRGEFENFLIKDESWRLELGDTAFDEMYKGADALDKALVSIRFTDSRTLQKMNELSLPTSSYIIYTPLQADASVSLPKSTWHLAAQMAFPPEKFHSDTDDFIIDYFKKRTWELIEDIPQQRAVRTRIQKSVPEKYTKISAGSRIIDQGDRVTSRHVAILQAMKNAMNEQRNLWHPSTLAGSLMLSLLLTAICAAFVHVHYPEIMASNRKLFLIVTVIVLTFIIAKSVEFFFLTNKSNLIEVIRYPLFVPFSAILLCSLLNPAIATFTSAFLTIILMMGLAFERQGFMILNLATALIAILSAKGLRQRREVFVVCGKAWLCSMVVIISMHLYQSTDWNGFWVDIFSAGGFMLLTAVLVVGLLPLLESGFKIMTDVTLMEFMDPNHDLLRRLSIEAPGTYQHSVVVGNLAEAAALAIGANGLFCRVATLYHDIGKMATPQYFSENQHGEGMNIHQLLTPQESAQVIIAHVSEGVAMARKANLPEQFIDVIKEHHGTTLVYFFYRKMLKMNQEGAEVVNLGDFRYSGPEPRSKESAIIMIADSLESASRSLDEFNKETVWELTSRIIKEKSEEGQFDHTCLTLQELATVKETLVKTLVAYGHSRVKYPTREIGEETLKSEVNEF